jgi:signal peptidase I
MPLAYRITRLARRTLDVLLGALILFVLGVVVLARVIPILTGGGTFVVGGGSMEPAIPLGSVVVALPVAADQLAPGDVVSVRVGEQQALFTHRIVRLMEREDGLWLETKGDANDDPDPAIIPATGVVGRVAVTIPLLGYAVRMVATAPGIMFLLALGAFMLAAAWLLESLEIDQAAARRRAAQALTAMSPESRAGEGAAAG